MAKETRLKDNAQIYGKRENLTEREKFRGMNKEQKWQYFKDYYLKSVIFGVVIVAIVCYGIYTGVKPRTETVLYIAVINDALDTGRKETIQEQLSSYLQLDTKKEDVLVDDSFMEDSGRGMLPAQRLQTNFYADQIDVVIAAPDVFKELAQDGLLTDLSYQFSTELYHTFKDSLFMTELGETKEENTFGIYLSDCKTYKDLGGSIENPIIGIASNSKYKENGVSFIHYLFDLNE